MDELNHENLPHWDGFLWTQIGNWVTEQFKKIHAAPNILDHEEHPGVPTLPADAIEFDGKNLIITEALTNFVTISQRFYVTGTQVGDIESGSDLSAIQLAATRAANIAAHAPEFLISQGKKSLKNTLFQHRGLTRHRLFEVLQLPGSLGKPKKFQLPQLGLRRAGTAEKHPGNGKELKTQMKMNVHKLRSSKQQQTNEKETK